MRNHDRKLETKPNVQGCVGTCHCVHAFYFSRATAGVKRTRCVIVRAQVESFALTGVPPTGATATFLTAVKYISMPVFTLEIVIKVPFVLQSSDGVRHGMRRIVVASRLRVTTRRTRGMMAVEIVAHGERPLDFVMDPDEGSFNAFDTAIVLVSYALIRADGAVISYGGLRLLIKIMVSSY